MRPYAVEKDADKKKEIFSKYNSEAIQPHLQKIEAHLIKNGTGFLVGNAVIFYHVYNWACN